MGNMPRRMVLLMVTALVVATSGIATSAASGAGIDSVSCVDQHQITVGSGPWDQRNPLEEQHALETGTLRAIGEGPGVFAHPPYNDC